MLDYLSGKGYEFIRLDELLQATVREAALTEAERGRMDHNQQFA